MIIMEQTYMKLTVSISLILFLSFANVSLQARVDAQSTEPKDTFKVVVSLSGISSSTKDILILVNVNDQTKSKLFNAESPQIEGKDKVNYTITFPGSAIDEGDKYTVCIMSIKNFKVQCDEANNSPLNRPEFVDINLSAENEKEEPNGKDDKNA
jgi:hypothetical protein